MGFSGQEYWSGVPLPSPRYNAISIKLLMIFFTELELNPEIDMEPQKTQTCQSIPEEKRTKLEV